MPSGAKRRKAAKKKKEKETHNGTSSTNNNPQGDAKGSDGGEVGSDHNNQLNEGNEGRQVVAEDQSIEGEASDGVVRIERDSKEGSKSNKHAGSGKESNNGGGKSSSSSSSSTSSSSSDDESRVVDRRKKEKAYTSVSEEKLPSDLVKSVDSLLPEVTHTTVDALAGKTSLVEGKAPSIDSDKPVVSVTEETVHLTESTPVEGLVSSDMVVKPALESGAEKLLPTGAPVTLTDSVSEKIQSIVSPVLIENGKASPSAVESVSKGNESKVLPSSGVSSVEISYGAGSIKDSEIPEYSESQPLVAPAPRVVEKTSWFSCCGILDVITGSRR